VLRYVGESNDGAERCTCVMKRPTRHTANHTRMGKYFDKRMETGTMIDRSQQKPKKATYIEIPESLAKFFKPTGGTDEL
jgi:hypothetical protein